MRENEPIPPATYGEMNYAIITVGVHFTYVHGINVVISLFHIIYFCI